MGTSITEICQADFLENSINNKQRSLYLIKTSNVHLINPKGITALLFAVPEMPVNNMLKGFKVIPERQLTGLCEYLCQLREDLTAIQKSASHKSSSISPSKLHECVIFTAEGNVVIDRSRGVERFAFVVVLICGLDLMVLGETIHVLVC